MIVAAAAVFGVIEEALLAGRARILNSEVADPARLARSRAQCGHRKSFELPAARARVAEIAAATRAVVIEALLAHRACILDAGRPDLARLAGPRAQCGRFTMVLLLCTGTKVAVVLWHPCEDVVE